MDAKTNFFEVLKEEFAPRLREIGFTGSGQNFRRIRDEVINVVNVQGEKHGRGCAINLGLHLTFLPLIWPDKLPDTEKIKEYDCIFRKRLTPQDQSDYWWDYGRFTGSTARNARNLIEMFFVHGEPTFQKYDSVEKIGSMFKFEDLENGTYCGSFHWISIAWGALTMARIHHHLGNDMMARKFAKMGQLNVKSDVRFKPQFEEILNAI